MAAPRATFTTGKQEYPLSFNDIIGYTPGKGRGDAKPGKYQNRKGNVLVVFTKNPQFVEIEKRQNGRKTNRTGFTRTGMMIVEPGGRVRQVTADKKPDGDKNWKVFDGPVTIE